MLLMIEAVLFISVALVQDHRVSVKGLKLDMALNSVDDQYEGCREKMAQLVETKYLKKEISESQNFSKAWEEGENNTLEKKHEIAIHVYTGLRIYRDFNDAIREDKEKYKDMTYKWYSLHFLLTEAIQILKKQKNTCYHTYRGTYEIFDKDIQNKVVRFGSFTSSSLDIEVAKTFGNESCFEIYTCEGADISKYSLFFYEKEVLIPPYETFHVTKVKTRRDQKDLWCDTVFVMNSTGTKSDLNCAVANTPNILQKIANKFCCGLG